MSAVRSHTSPHFTHWAPSYPPVVCELRRHFKMTLKSALQPLGVGRVGCAAPWTRMRRGSNYRTRGGFSSPHCATSKPAASGPPFKIQEARGPSLRTQAAVEPLGDPGEPPLGTWATGGQSHRTHPSELRLRAGPKTPGRGGRKRRPLADHPATAHCAPALAARTFPSGAARTPRP